MKTICVTIPEKQAEFFESHYLRLSKFYQQKLSKIMENDKGDKE